MGALIFNGINENINSILNGKQYSLDFKLRSIELLQWPLHDNPQFKQFCIDNPKEYANLINQQIKFLTELGKRDTAENPMTQSEMNAAADAVRLLKTEVQRFAPNNETLMAGIERLENRFTGGEVSVITDKDMDSPTWDSLVTTAQNVVLSDEKRMAAEVEQGKISLDTYLEFVRGVVNRDFPNSRDKTNYQTLLNNILNSVQRFDVVTLNKEQVHTFNALKLSITDIQGRLENKKSKEFAGILLTKMNDIPKTRGESEKEFAKAKALQDRLNALIPSNIDALKSGPTQFNAMLTSLPIYQQLQTMQQGLTKFQQGILTLQGKPSNISLDDYEKLIAKWEASNVIKDTVNDLVKLTISQKQESDFQDKKRVGPSGTQKTQGTLKSFFAFLIEPYRVISNSYTGKNPNVGNVFKALGLLAVGAIIAGIVAAAVFIPGGPVAVGAILFVAIGTGWATRSKQYSDEYVGPINQQKPDFQNTYEQIKEKSSTGLDIAPKLAQPSAGVVAAPALKSSEPIVTATDSDKLRARATSVVTEHAIIDDKKTSVDLTPASSQPLNVSPIITSLADKKPTNFKGKVADIKKSGKGEELGNTPPEQDDKKPRVP